MSPFEDFIARWSGTRNEFDRLGVMVNGVRLLDQVLADVQECRTQAEEKVVRLSEAGHLSGYSVDHLARLVRQGKIPNAGRRNAPRIRVGDLPIRSQFARTRPGSYDVMTDARSLRTQR